MLFNIPLMLKYIFTWQKSQRVGISLCLFLLRSKLQKSLWAVTAAMKLRCLLLHFTSVTQFYPTLCDPMDCSTPGFLSFPISQCLFKLKSIESVMPSNHLILCHPLLLPLSVFPSIRVFSNESVFHIRWPKYWSFSFNISPYSEYSGLISFRMDWLDLLAVQGTLKSLFQHHSSKINS